MELKLDYHNVVKNTMTHLSLISNVFLGASILKETKRI